MTDTEPMKQRTNNTPCPNNTSGIGLSFLSTVFVASCATDGHESYPDERIDNIATVAAPLAGGDEENVWGDYWFGGHVFPNITDPIDNQTFSLGFNITPNSTLRDPNTPAWMMTFESWYELCPGCNHLHEWHIQWRGTDGTARRPLTVGVSPEEQAGAVSIFGRATVHDDVGDWRFSVAENGIWSNGLAYVNDTNDSPMLMQRRSDKNGQHGGWAEFARINDNDEVEIGRGASGVRFSASNKPVVTSCEDLIVALDAMGLIEDATE